jgi:AbrB family looped-hinge helix DNA binding protein
MAAKGELQQTPVFSVEPEPLRAKITIGEKGRIVIPAAIREALGFEPGEAVDLEVREHELHIFSRSGRRRGTQERALKFFGPDRSLADELIAERRAAALLE